MLRERRHGPVQRRDGRDEVLLVLVELGEVLLAHSVRLPESGVVLRDLLPTKVDKCSPNSESFFDHAF